MLATYLSPVIDFVRDLSPSHYWSAGFMAWLIVVAAGSFLLFVITRWRGWLVSMLAALLYFIPFIAGKQ